jgi:hypothetical protein
LSFLTGCVPGLSGGIGEIGLATATGFLSGTGGIGGRTVFLGMAFMMRALRGKLKHADAVATFEWILRT